MQGKIIISHNSVIGGKGGKMEFKIEKNIPIPLHRGKYPFSKMIVGDSFKLDIELLLKVRTASYSWISRFGKGKRFLAKPIIEKGKKVGRCWRIK